VQLAIPHWPHRLGGPHVDGITRREPGERPGMFSLLAEAWLSDQDELNRGNCGSGRALICGSAPGSPSTARTHSYGPT
jgi:hypothetical protein